MDFGFNRVCDGFPYGSRVDKDLTVQVFTPLGATAEPELWENSRFQRDSASDGGQVVIKLDDDQPWNVNYASTSKPKSIFVPSLMIRYRNNQAYPSFNGRRKP